MIPEALFRTFLHDMKNNGALFFEMYFDETVTAFTDMLNGQVFPDKAEATRGVSLRAFDGENHLCVTTEDLTDENLRALVWEMARQLSPANNKKPLPFDAPENIGAVTLNSAYDWNRYHESIIRRISAEQAQAKETFGEGIQVKTRCYFQNQKVQLLSSRNGAMYDARSRCCIRTEAVNGDARVTNILTPVSYDDLKSAIRKNGLVCKNRNSGPDPVPCPEGCFDLVLLSGSSSLFFHECCGHPLEIYNAMRPDAIFRDKIGRKVASDCVSLYDSGVREGLWGSISVDDEGNPARETVLIRNGVLEGYLTDLVEGYRYGMEPTGNTRRQYYRKAPTARMTNTYLAGGWCRENDIIRSTKEGLLIRSFSFGNVNPVTGDFTVRITSGNLIRNGAIEEPFRGGVIRANALEVLSSIDRVADNLSFTNGFCHAASGRITVSGGQPTVRITGVPVFADN